MDNTNELIDCGFCGFDSLFTHLNRDCPTHGEIAATLARKRHEQREQRERPNAAAGERVPMLVQLPRLPRLPESVFARLREAAEKLRAFQLPQCTGTENAPMRAHWPGTAANCGACSSSRERTS